MEALRKRILSYRPIPSVLNFHTLRGRVLVLACLACATAHAEVFPFRIDPDRLAGAPDFSYLNHPLGPADRIFVRDGRFYRVGADGRPNTADDQRVRLFGVTLGLFPGVPDPALAPIVARRLRRLGVNLVRYPSAQLVDSKSRFPTLDAAAIERFRGWLKALKAEGIYLDLILQSGYMFRPEVDGFPPLPTDAKEVPFASKIYIFYPGMVDRQTQWTRMLIRALHLEDDPQLAVCEVHNEGALIRAWQTLDLDKYLSGDYKIELERQWRAFLREKYGPGHEDAPLLAGKDNYTAPPRLVDDFSAFLVSRDRAYWNAMRAAVRDVANPLIPVSGTQMEYGGLLNLESQADMDYQDNHFYIDHPNFPGVDWDAANWRIRETSSTGSGMWTLKQEAAAREAAFPFTISEYNQPWPNPYCAEIDPELAAFGAFQDWDSIMHFLFSTRGVDEADPVPRGMNLNGNWAQFANVGQSAWLFRTGAIEVARRLVEIPITADLRWKVARARRSHNLADTLSGFGIYRETLALVHRIGLVKAEDHPHAPPIPDPGVSPYRSDTREFAYDEDRKIFFLHAPLAAGVFGFLGTEKPAVSGPLEVRLAGSASGFAAILLTARDGKPIAESTRLLLSTPGGVMPTQPGTNPPRPQRLVPYGTDAGWWTIEKDPATPEKMSGPQNSGVAPLWMERVESYLTLHIAARRLTVYPLDGAGARVQPLPAAAVSSIGGGYRIHLQGAGQFFTPWYEITVEK